jgi:chromosome partitioning protein
MIITVGNSKGGVGKTTVAIQLAVEVARAGRRVWLVDGDRQGTALSAITLRGDREPAIPCAAYADGPTLRKQVQAQADLYDVTVIDAGGRDSSALRAALVLSDLVLVPFQPRSFDVWGLDDMASLLEEARSYVDVDAAAMLNAADPRGQDNEDAAAAVAEYPLRYIDAQLGRRKAFANAAGQGLSVNELGGSKDPKASTELAALYDAVFTA